MVRTDEIEKPTLSAGLRAHGWDVRS